MTQRESERLVYRGLGNTSYPYPDWVRELHGKSGVYVIKGVSLFSTTILYVGESHTNRLYETMTRHFQSWRRAKKWWVGGYVVSDNDPGTTYDREACEVAVRFTPANVTVSVAVQNELIRKLKPTDNKLGTKPVRPSPLPPAPF